MLALSPQLFNISWKGNPRNTNELGQNSHPRSNHYYNISETEFIKKESELLAKLNSNRNGEKLPNISQRTLRRMIAMLNQGPISKYSRKTDYYSQMGKNVQLVQIRKYLLENAPSKNSFVLSAYESGLRSNFSNHMMKSMDFYNLIEETPQNGGERRECANRYFAFLSWLNREVYSKGMEKFFKPYLDTAVKTETKELFVNVIRAIFKGYRQGEKTFTYKTEQISENEFRCTGYADDEKISDATAKTEDEAEMYLFKRIMSDYCVYPLNRDNKELRKNVFNVENIKDAVHKMLVNVGFILFESALTKNCDKQAPDYILRALSPTLKINDGLNFQKFEYYGDAVCNMETELFLLEKKLPIDIKEKFYSIMKSNATFEEYFDKIKLEKYLLNPDKSTPKYKADAFEALIGALHYSYDERLVYAFLQPLFEAKYQELMNTLQPRIKNNNISNNFEQNA